MSAMVQVQVSEGVLEGEEVQNEYGGTYYSFRGVPYARPPLGELRFKAPQPAQPWEGIRSATKFGPICCQYNPEDLRDVADQPEMNEDCLYLNVYTPDIKPSELLPVMVFIHGGGYMNGSGNDDYYGPQFLIRYGVILVTFNYRLEALGFLCLHTADVPGNAGMKDQVAALRWVKKNIINFGGDSDNITIFGESAGGCSVSYHLISPITKGLFKRAIVQSGAATCWWAQDFGSRDTAFLLAKRLGCFSEEEQTVNEFLLKQPVESLVNLKLPIWKGQKPYDLHFSIADEKDFGQERFFYGDVTDALRTKAHEGVEIMIGYTKDEGLVTLYFGHSLKDFIDEAKYFNEFLAPRWIKQHCVIADQLEVGRRMREFYFKDKNITENTIMKFLNTDMITYGVILFAKLYSKKDKVYFYKFNCVSKRNIFAGVGLSQSFEDDTIVCHGDDLAYLFPIKLLSGKVDESSEEFKLIDKVTALWTNFSKYGNPTPGDSLGVQWKPYTLQNQEYLDIGNKLKMATAPDEQEIQFWETIFEGYLKKYSANSG